MKASNYSYRPSPPVTLKGEEWVVIPWRTEDGSIVNEATLPEGRCTVEAEFSVSGITDEQRAYDLVIERQRLRPSAPTPVERVNATHKVTYPFPRSASYMGIPWADNHTWVDADESWVMRAKLEAPRGTRVTLTPIAQKGWHHRLYIAEGLEVVPK